MPTPCIIIIEWGCADAWIGENRIALLLYLYNYSLHNAPPLHWRKFLYMRCNAGELLYRLQGCFVGSIWADEETSSHDRVIIHTVQSWGIGCLGSHFCVGSCSTVSSLKDFSRPRLYVRWVSRVVWCKPLAYHRGYLSTLSAHNVSCTTPVQVVIWGKKKAITTFSPSPQ